MKKCIGVLYCAAVLALFPAFADEDKSTRIGMIHCCVESDTFMWNIAENIQRAAQKDHSTILFHNAEGNQEAQLQALKKLQGQNIGALLVSIVVDDTIEKPFQKEFIETLKQSGIPVVFYLLGVEDRFLQTYDKAYRVGSIPAQSGILQGEMISEHWLSHPEWDTNHDGIMQYAILKGPAGNPDAEGRTKWVRATLTTFPSDDISVEEIDLKTANWSREQAKNIVSQWIQDGTAEKIEVLIANNDDMLLGARDALLASDDKPAHKPALFGIDALPEVLNLISRGEIAGTILQDTKAQAANAYQLAANLAKKRTIDTDLDYPVVRQELIVPYVPVDRKNAESIR